MARVSITNVQSAVTSSTCTSVSKNTGKRYMHTRCHSKTERCGGINIDSPMFVPYAAKDSETDQQSVSIKERSTPIE